MDTKNATEYCGYAGTLDRAIEILLYEQMNDNNVYIVFNEHKLYANNITIDGAYKEVVGCTKKQHKIQQSVFFEQACIEEKINKQSPKSKIDAFIKQGEALIYPERREDWEKCVRLNIEHENGIGVENALQIMKALDKNVKIQEANELISREHTGSSFNLTLKMVGMFSKRGVNFYRSNMMGNFTNDTRKFIDKIDSENKIFASNELLNNCEKER